jgi:hypothetical protein
MVQKFSLLKRVSKRTCSWFALSLLAISSLLLFGQFWRVAPSSSLKTWEVVVALLLSLQVVLSASIKQLIQSHLPTRLRKLWISDLIEACLLGLLVFLTSLLFSPVWDHVLLILQGPFVIVLVVATLVMMGFYISGRFS